MFALLVGLLMSGAPADPHGYQNTRWGMSEAEVKRLYPKCVPITMDDDHFRKVIGFPGEISGRSASIGFAFGDDDRLMAAVIIFSNHSCDGFDLVDGALSSKYGAAQEAEKVSWSNQAAKDIFDGDADKAVAAGRARMQASRKVGQTLILHMCAADSSSVKHIVTFAGIAQLKSVRAKEKEKASEGL